MEEFSSLLYYLPHKNKQQGEQQQCWRQFRQMNAHHSHIFSSFPKIQTFRDVEISSYKIPRDSQIAQLGLIPEDIIPLKDIYLSKILIMRKSRKRERERKARESLYLLILHHLTENFILPYAGIWWHTKLLRQTLAVIAFAIHLFTHSNYSPKDTTIQSLIVQSSLVAPISPP